QRGGVQDDRGHRPPHVDLDLHLAVEAIAFGGDAQDVVPRHDVLRELPRRRREGKARLGARLREGECCDEGEEDLLQFARGSGRSWNFTTRGRLAVPPSLWNTV